MDKTTLPFVATVKQLPPAPIGQRPPIGEDYLSSSQLWLLAKCGVRYWLKYGEHLAEAPNSAMIFGSAVHTAQEVFFKALRERPDADLEPIIETAIACAIDCVEREIATNADTIVWRPRYQKSKDLDDLETLAAKIKAAVPTLALAWTQYRPLSIEQGWLIRWCDPKTGEPDGTLPFVGFEDLVAQRDENAIIVDLKTGSSKSEEDIRRDAGVVGYALAHEIFSGVPTRDVEYINYICNKEPKVAVIKHHLTERDFERLYLRCKIATKRIAHGIYDPADDKFACEKCPFRKRCDAFYSLGEFRSTPAA